MPWAMQALDIFSTYSKPYPYLQVFTEIYVPEGHVSMWDFQFFHIPSLGDGVCNTYPLFSNFKKVGFFVCLFLLILGL